MEIKDVIEGTISGLIAKRSMLLKQIEYCENELHRWIEIKKISNSESLMKFLGDCREIKDAVSKSDYDKHILGRRFYDPFTIEGFDIDNIHTYLELKNSSK